MIAGPAAVPRLRPRLDPLVADLLNRPALVHHWLDAWGSPLNLVIPALLEANVARLRAVLDRRLPGGARLFYAHKANPAPALVGAAVAAGIGVDVASPGELASALGAGAGPAGLEGTGPKGQRFLTALLDAGAVVNVDSVAELDLLTQCLLTDCLLTDCVHTDCIVTRCAPAGQGPPVPVLARLTGGGSRAGGEAAGARTISRFGIPPHQWPALVDHLVAHRAAVELLGVSFHLDTADTGERVTAVQGCLQVLEAAWRAGLEPRVIDVGGGLRQVFLDDAASYAAYTSALRAGLTGAGPALTWNGNTFGYRAEGSSVRGVPVVHRYANDEPAERSLERLLDLPLPAHGNRALADVVADNLLELWLEPGKALVDQAGVTVARVELVTEAADGSILVLLDLSRDKVCPADSEVFVDPVLLPHPGGGAGGGPAAVFLAGNLCLERDMITNRLVAFDRCPAPGDAVVFANTAAYHMDLSASDALLQPRPRRLRVERGAAGSFDARPDPLDEPCSTTTSPS